MIFFGIAGLVIASVAIWLKNETWQDILFLLGGSSLLVYSLYRQDIIFIMLQVVFIISVSIELFKLSRK
jgi:lipid-A-disaccharide synthase-like uncharacterized protein